MLFGTGPTRSKVDDSRMNIQKCVVPNDYRLSWSHLWACLFATQATERERLVWTKEHHANVPRHHRSFTDQRWPGGSLPNPVHPLTVRWCCLHPKLYHDQRKGDSNDALIMSKYVDQSLQLWLWSAPGTSLPHYHLYCRPTQSKTSTR